MKSTNDSRKILNNKTIHVEIPGEIHRKLRALLFLKESSIQSFFRLMAESFVEGDEYINKKVEKRVNEIKENSLSITKSVNEKDLYNAIEKNSPIDSK